MPNQSATHTQTRQAIVEYLRYIGATVYCNLGGLGHTRGRADVTACVQGRYVDVEIKTGKGVQSADQRDQEALVKRAKGLYIVAHSVDDVEDALVAAGLTIPRLNLR